MDTKQRLNEILNHQKARIRSVYPSKDVVFPLIEVIRTLDYHAFILNNDANVQENELLLRKYQFGWGQVFQSYYKDLVLSDDIPVFSWEQSERKWIDQIVQHAGSVQIASQFLDYCKADLMDLQSEDDTNFTFNHLATSPGVEFFERISLAYYFSIIEKILSGKKAKLLKDLPVVRKKLEGIVNAIHNKFISYKADDELDEFYARFGYLYLMTTQVVDDFDESDTFGGISYKHHLDQVEFVIRSAIMHRDCCMALAKKTADRIYLRDILTYCFSITSQSGLLSDYFNLSPDTIREIISCITLNKDNIEYHLSYPGASAPPYIQIGVDTMMRSTYGSLDKPVLFLNRELKRKYPKDFFNAVNNREIRFKKQLYDLFPQDRIIKIFENVIIRPPNGETDIDGIIYDRERHILGLFQLKWQDSFSTSMKERFSRISNLIPKSVEWIEKVSLWLKSNDEKSILRTLKIDNSYTDIKDVHLFVLSRNHVHFTDQILDQRAIWSSWFQAVEAIAQVKSHIRDNPIAEFAAALKFFSPEIRIKRESIPVMLDFDIKLAEHRIYFKGTQQPRV